MSEQKWLYGHRPRPFWPKALTFGLICCAAGGAALFWLWGALERYEASTPEAAILRNIQMVQGDVEYEVPADLLPSRFANAQQYRAAARDLVGQMPAQRDELRFLKKESGDVVRYIVEDEDGTRADFVLYPKENGWDAWLQVPSLAAVTVRAPEGVALALDGLRLDEDEPAQTQPVPGFEELGEQAPRQCVWQVEGLLELPELAAQSELGACTVQWETPLSATVTVQPDDRDAAELEAFFGDCARRYARYVSADLSFGELSGRLVRDTQLYESLRTFDSSWYVSHDSTDFEEFAISELVWHGPDAASGTVRFNYIVYKQGLRPRSYPSEYRMHAVRQDGGWKLLNLQVQ